MKMQLRVSLTGSEARALITPLIIARDNAQLELNRAVNHRNERVITAMTARLSASEAVLNAIHETFNESEQ